jgi:hypothetical protein
MFKYNNVGSPDSIYSQPQYLKEVPANYLEIHEGNQNLAVSPKPAAPSKPTHYQDEEEEEEGFGEVREWTDAVSENFNKLDDKIKEFILKRCINMP